MLAVIFHTVSQPPLQLRPGWGVGARGVRQRGRTETLVRVVTTLRVRSSFYFELYDVRLGGVRRGGEKQLASLGATIAYCDIL